MIELIGSYALLTKILSTTKIRNQLTTIYPFTSSVASSSSSSSSSSPPPAPPHRSPSDPMVHISRNKRSHSNSTSIHPFKLFGNSDENISNIFINQQQQQKYSPYYFLDSNDWQIYDEIIKREKETSDAPEGQPENVVRILQAFQKLFDEFTKLTTATTTTAAAPATKAGETPAEEKLSTTTITLSANQCCPSQLFPNQTESKFMKSIKKSKEKLLLNPFHCHSGASTRTQSQDRNLSLPPTTTTTTSSTSSKFRTFLSSLRSKPTAPIFYEEIQKTCGHSLQVYQIPPNHHHHHQQQQQQHQRNNKSTMSSHVIHCNVLHEDGKIRATWLDLPLYLELELHRVKMMIEEIQCQCPFVVDPMEIVAELRSFQFDVRKCIDYFVETSFLRQTKTTTTTATREEKYVKLNKISYLKLQKLIEKLFELQNECESVKEFIQQMNLQMKQTIQLILSRFSTIDNNSRSRSSGGDNGTGTGNVNTSLSASVPPYALPATASTTTTTSKPAAAQNSTALRILSRQVTLLQEQIKLKEQQNEKLKQFLLKNLYGKQRVYCRIRKICPIENVTTTTTTTSAAAAAVVCKNDKIILLHNQQQPNVKELFTFDKVFNPQTTQMEIFNEFQPLITAFIDGINVNFVTYGGEASGKTFTLIGNESLELTATAGTEGGGGGGGGMKSNIVNSNQGLLYRAAKMVLNYQKTILKNKNLHLQMEASVLEIYNNQFIDLLSENIIEIHSETGAGAAGGTGGTVGLEQIHNNLQKLPLNELNDIQQLINSCQNKRKFSASLLNSQSSRSHLFIFIRLFYQQQQTISFLTFSDLSISTAVDNENINNEMDNQTNNTAFQQMFITLQKKSKQQQQQQQQQQSSTCTTTTTTTTLKQHIAAAPQWNKLLTILKCFQSKSNLLVLIATVRNDNKSIAISRNILKFAHKLQTVKSIDKTKKNSVENKNKQQQQQQQQIG